jgi:hypothetical protein
VPSGSLDIGAIENLPIVLVNGRIASRNELDAMVVNVELTLGSIIQGVALSFLASSASTVLDTGRASTWPYVFAGLIIILLFWVRSLIHTLTLMRWPLELGHNCLYFASALVQVLAFTHLADPFMWFALLALFAATVLAVFVYDLKVIRARMSDSSGEHGCELYRLVLRDQWLNIRFVVPLLFFYNLGAALAIRAQPEFFLARGGHLILIISEAVGLSLYLWFIIRSFAQLTPLVAATREDWRNDPTDHPDK